LNPGQDLNLANKHRLSALLNSHRSGDTRRLRADLLEFWQQDAVINVAQPVNGIAGPEAFIDQVLEPMQSAFAHLYRRADMLLGGEYQGSNWVVSHGHWVGEFRQPWMGIPPSHEITWIHYVEYHRMVEGHAVESYLYWDMLDLLRQAGYRPRIESLGQEGFIPGPASGDGVLLEPPDPAASDTSLRLVDKMLQELWQDTRHWRRYWHPDMAWYGPSGYGSFIGLDGFERFQLPYEAMFDPNRFASTYRRSGDPVLDATVQGHLTRFGDGDYVASAGWPSHGGFMMKLWLGVDPAGQMFAVRVADIWRREGDLLVENWVLVDLVDMLLQLGRDVFTELEIEINLP
jgi:hypothetical protein